MMSKRRERDAHQSVFVCYCNTGECEDEIHFMFACSWYNDIRESILEPVFKNKVKNPLMLDTDKLSHLMKLKHRELYWKSLAQKTIRYCIRLILLYGNIIRCIIYVEWIHKRSILNIMFMFLLCFTYLVMHNNEMCTVFFYWNVYIFLYIVICKPILVGGNIFI